MKTYRQKDITVQAKSLEEAEVLILNELDSKGRVNDPLEVMEEYNKGWIKIESEDDLPKEDGDYYILVDGLIRIDTYSQCIKEFQEYFNIGITHYQPIVKPLPPLY